MDEKQQKNIYLSNKIARETSRRWAILSYNTETKNIQNEFSYVIKV